MSQTSDPGPGAAILVVDDDAANRRLMQSALSGQYALTFAVDGLGAVASACAEPFDLVLMDVNMPGIDGIEATRRIRERMGIGAPPIIMLTAFSDHDSVNAAFEAGAADYVAKPFNLKELLGRIRSSIERKHMRDDLVRARDGLETQVRERTASLLEARDALEDKVRALREAEDRLQASLAHMDGILTSVRDAILTTGEDGRIVSINRAAVRLFGYMPDELVGRDFAELLPEGWRASLSGEMRRQAQTEAVRASGFGSREMEGLRMDGSVFPIEIALSEMRVGGKRLFVGVVRDITERKHNAERIAQLANFDTVTGLANRNLFLERLDRAMRQALRSDRLIALLYMDLDGFKRVNDTLGHHVGDELLRSVGERLSAVVRKTDTVARVGGDEFTIVLEGLESVESVSEVARKILDAMRQPFHLQGYEVVVSISVGATIFPFDTEDIAELLKNADKAMYQAKEAGRNQVQFYEHSLSAVQIDRLKLEEELRRAASAGNLSFHYQPQFDLAKGRIVGVEALLRWISPGKESLSPAEFVPLLESTGLIMAVGRDNLRTAAAQVLAWRAQGFDGLRVAVNLSQRQFDNAALVDDIDALIGQTGIKGSDLEIEITENTVIRNVAESAAKLRGLRERGISIALDDFGTGYSSLSYLRQFPIDVLKIDRSFVKDIEHSQNSRAIATTIIAMAHSLDMTVIAEGVETGGQLRILHEHGCQMIQGYYISKALDAQGITELLGRERDGALVVGFDSRVSA